MWPRPIPGLVSAEVVERLCTMFRQWSMVPVMRIVAVVDMTVKTRMSVKPRSGSDKDPTKEPIGAISTRRVRSHRERNRSTHKGTRARPRC